MLARAFVLSIRIAAAGALVLVATYYMLASMPFSYYHFLQFPHFWWMPLFIRIHPLVLLLAVAALLLTVRAAPDSLKSWIRYAAVGAAAGAACMVTFAWQPDWLSYEVASALCFVPLGLLAMAGAIILKAHSEIVVITTYARPGVRRLIAVAAVAGALCSAGYFADAIARGASNALQPLEVAVAALASIVAHVMVFVLAALVVALIGAAAARRHWRRGVEQLAVGGWAALLFAVLIRRSVFTALMLGDLRSTILAAALAIAITTFWAALWVSHADHIAGVDMSRPAIERRPPPEIPWWWHAVVRAAGVGLCLAILPRLLLLADWGLTIQKLVVFAAWAALVGVVVALPAGRWRRLALAVGLATLLGAATAGVVSARTRVNAVPRAHDGVDLSLAIDRYATFDTSLTVLVDVFRPFVTNSEFFDVLARAGQVTDDSSLPAVRLGTVGEPRGISTPYPNIFVIVIDSLRPDYVSAYNAAATFEPALGAFAADSIVMRHAFTSYAGTALSEPALWAGGLIPRAMYVKPFSPMNNLERLLQLGGNYRRYISVDAILSGILADRTRLTRLDTQLTHPDRPDEAFKFDLCTTLSELTDRLDRDASTGPVFFYSQPQSLHIRMLVPEGIQVPHFEPFRVGTTEFFKPAATILARLDACFGQFIGHLKAAGIYDDSIIVVTSDHGDAYGDANRWGHAYYLAPETMRIPLIMHVPERLRAGRVWDTNAVARSIDITPTLYDLLGYRLSDRSGLLGRSLMPRAEDARPSTGDPFLIQSSYSRVYGLIDGRGRWMYAANVNQQREEFYDLVEGGPYPTVLMPADRLQYRKWLLDRMEQVNRFYAPVQPSKNAGSPRP